MVVLEGLENILQWLGCGFGIVGSALLALNNSNSGWGFVAFLISNIFWMWFGFLTSTPGIVIMQVAFTATSFFGIYRWLFKRSS